MGMSALGKSLHEAACDLGGLFRKVMQQLSSRPDIVTCAVIRHELMKLLADTTPRPREKIQAQLHAAFGSSWNLQDVLKAGTIGEVSRVNKDGVCCALKTVQKEEQHLYKRDFEIVNGLTSSLESIFACIPDRAQFINSVINKVRDFTADAKPGILEEFDLRIESENLSDVREASRQLCSSEAWSALGLGATCVTVPSVTQVSSSGDALLMEFVQGQNLHDFMSDLLPDDRYQIAYALSAVFIHGLLVAGVLHADLHAGNIMVDKSESLKITIVDCGSVLRGPPDQKSRIRKLLRFIHERRDVGPQLTTLLQELGVEVRQNYDGTAEEHYGALKDMFDIAWGASGTQDVASALKLTERFQLPAWMLRWQKATLVCVSTLTQLGMHDRADLDNKILDIMERLS